jgi:hypothetical protein
MSFGMMDVMTSGDLIVDPSVQSLGNYPFIKEKKDFTSSVLLFHRFSSFFVLPPHSYRTAAAVLQSTFAFSKTP